MPPIVIASGPKQKIKKGSVKKLWQYFKKYKSAVIISLIVSIIAGGLSAVSIYLYGMIYDYLMSKMQQQGTLTAMIEGWSAFIFTCMGLLTSYVISNVFNWLASFLIMRISERGTYHLRTSVFKKLHKLPIKYFDQTPSGDIISRTSNDVDNISSFIAQYMGNCIFWICSITSIVLLMFLTNWALSLIILCIYPVVGLANAFIIKKIKPYFAKQQKSLGDLNGFAEEYISGTKIISLFQMEDKVKANFDTINEQLTKNSTVANGVANVMMPLNMFFNNLSFVLLSAWGMSFILFGWINKDWGVLNISNDITLLIMFTMFARNLTNPLNQLISAMGQFMLCMASAERIFQVLEQPEEQDPENAIKLNKEKLNGIVEAKHMDFGYEPKTLILKDINFIARPGTITALVGPTGAGKTTIVNLITKFYDINKGDLLIDNKPIKNIDRYTLRENITMVLQDTYLFGTTIRENIRYGRLDATNKEIVAAAKLANCHDFIMKLPKGYDTVLTDNGENLSQGQRQLLAIARAFLADSKIVILDEATSSIDTKTEIQIQTAMERLIKNRTTFMIAHRLSTIRDADNILVINHGQIVEHGKHDQLIKDKGFYYELYMSQFRGNQI